MGAPIVFISYSHDSTAHKAWALKLASDLRARGIDVILDQWDLAPGQDVSLFMQKGIADADRVLMICSRSYIQRAETGNGGVGYERLIVTAEVIQSIDTKKFIPIVRDNSETKKVPLFLGPRMYVDFHNDTEYEIRLDELVREIHGAPAVTKPPLGPNPFSGMPIAPVMVGAKDARDNVLESEWFAQQRISACAGIKKLNLTGHMELRIGIKERVVKSQIELLDAVRQSEIKTFGWPIGITLENVEAYRPRPYGDGIRAEISIDDGPSSRTTYDYWSLRSNGDFYLLQSLFEDSRSTDKIFFDTRIVRVTESLMFAENLYRRLGGSPEAKVVARVAHDGLRTRQLASASPNRLIYAKTTLENESLCEIETTLRTMKETRVDDVKALLAPLFMLFDFQEFQHGVYEEIVRRFERGQI